VNDAIAQTPLKSRRTARDRLVRRRRIMDRLREGRSYEEIAEAEGLSRERIRQIVVEALKQRQVDAQQEHAQLQMLRLAPALRLAARGVAEGDRKAIAELIRVLDRLDKYQAAGAAAGSAYDEEARERLLNKLNAMARRMGVRPRDENEGASDSAAGQEQAAGSENPASPFPWGLRP
jgi:uncharacterized protein (DUF433 family)